MATIYKYHPDGSQSSEPYEGGHHMTDWQRAVEGFFEVHQMPDGNVAVLNEEAGFQPDEFPVNHMFLAHHPIGWPVRGNVLVLSHDEYMGKA